MYLLAWLPERLLNEKGQTEWDKFISTEEKTTDRDEEEGPPPPVLREHLLTGQV